MNTLSPLYGQSWRILGAIEGAARIVMLGWSIASLVSLRSQLRLLTHDWRTPPEPARHSSDQTGA